MKRRDETDPLLNLPTEFWDLPLSELAAKLQASPDGLKDSEAKRRLQVVGPNSIAANGRASGLIEFLRFFANPLVIILLVASVISFIVGEHIGASIIVVMVLLSVILNFSQEYQAKHAVEKLRAQVASTSVAVRDGVEREIPSAELVPGDVIRLKAGSLVPADARLIEEDDLHVRESALTGESLPVEKDAADLTGGSHSITEAVNSVFMGTSVQSGIGKALVVRTGASTIFGGIAKRLASREPETEFDRGMRVFGLMIMRVVVLLVLGVFLINMTMHRHLLESFLFAIALAVGLTPELLPVIISVTLAKGARRMAEKQVITKQLASIENFGSMEILCSDKTGTLTLGEVILERHVDIAATDDENVLRMVYLNSYFEAGVKSPLDDAILAHDHPNIQEFTKLDEIPFDFDRRRLSVAVQRGDQCTLITKGAVENVFDVCTTAIMGGKAVEFRAECRSTAEATYRSLSSDGYRVLGVACRTVPPASNYDRSEEHDMTLIGFAAFLDPPKTDVAKTLEALKSDGVTVLVMTGDNEYVTQKIAKDVGLPAESVVTGAQMDGMDDASLAYKAEQRSLFARVSPEQKNRVITALRARGWVVGFLGDGINDAPSMHTADVGISVVNGVDVAKDAANIILLQKDLGVLHEGIVEGRKSFANIMKYIIMGTSSNFGNMFSMAVASLFLPFLPMLPTQILLNNFLYDTSQMSIPSDNVDEELLRRPKRWQIGFIKRFMLILGPISSIYDFLTFGTLLFVFKANEQLFHTGWFVESLATQTLVIFIIRTSASPLISRPSKPLVWTVSAAVILAFILPYTPLGGLLGFVPLQATLVGAIVALTVTYLLLVQLVKNWFYRRYSLM